MELALSNASMQYIKCFSVIYESEIKKNTSTQYNDNEIKYNYNDNNNEISQLQLQFVSSNVSTVIKRKTITALTLPIISCASQYKIS